jgi:hypothetical protein
MPDIFVGSNHPAAHDERRRHQQMECGGVRRGNTTTSQIGHARSDGMERDMTRGNSAMRGRVADRLEVVA